MCGVVRWVFFGEWPEGESTEAIGGNTVAGLSE